MSGIRFVVLFLALAGFTTHSDPYASDPNFRPISGELTPQSIGAWATTNTSRALTGVSITETENRAKELSIRDGNLCFACANRFDSWDNLVVPWSGFLAGLTPLSEGQKIIATVSDNQYVTALQVCLSGQSDPSRRRLKGVRIWGGHLQQNGPTTVDRVVRNGVTYESTLPNCAIWYEKQMCIGQRVGVGIRARYDGSRSKPWITGLELQCAYVVM